MKPGPLGWAENINYVAGPGIGQKTKVAPTLAQEGDGYYPTYRPAPQIWNYERWSTFRRLTGAVSMRLLNWVYGHTASIVGANGERGRGAYDATAGIHDVVSFGAGAGFIVEVISSAGYAWVDGTAPADAMTGLQALSYGPDIATDGAGGRAIAGGDLGAWHSAARAAWAQGAWNDGIVWWKIAHDHVGLWAVGGDMSTPAVVSIRIAASSAVAWALPATPPGFTVLGNILICLEHSHHPTAKIYPSDPGNPVWMAMTTTQVSSSADGNIWTAAAAHGFGAGVSPISLAYSAAGTKWIALRTDKGISSSTDNGVTWTGSAPFTGSKIVGVIGLDGQISCDGYGEWCVTMQGVDAGANPIQETWVSWDNGTTWRLVFGIGAPTAAPGMTMCWHGQGRFYVINTDAAGTFDSIQSWRAEE